MLWNFHIDNELSFYNIFCFIEIFVWAKPANKDHIYLILFNEFVQKTTCFVVALNNSFYGSFAVKCIYNYLVANAAAMQWWVLTFLNILQKDYNQLFGMVGYLVSNNKLYFFDLHKIFCEGTSSSARIPTVYLILRLHIYMYNIWTAVVYKRVFA